MNFFWQGGSSRPEAAAEGRETSEVKEETYASCIEKLLNYEAFIRFYLINPTLSCKTSTLLPNPYKILLIIIK
jgi:hypothetical protein